MPVSTHPIGKGLKKFYLLESGRGRRQNTVSATIVVAWREGINSVMTVLNVCAISFNMFYLSSRGDGTLRRRRGDWFSKNVASSVLWLIECYFFANDYFSLLFSGPMKWNI